MAAPDVNAVPGDIEPPAGGDAGSGAGGGGESLNDLAVMEEIMRSEEAVSDAAGFEMRDIPQPSRTPPSALKPRGEKPDDAPAGDKPDDAAADKPDDKAAAAAKPPADGKTDAKADADKKPEDKPDDKPPELEAPKIDVEAETKRLRKENLRLISERAAIVKKTNEANAALERARQFEADAASWRSIGDQVKADPVGFVLKYAELGEGDEGVQKLLDKVIELEKSPEARRLDALERERAAEKAANEKAAKEREEAEKRANNDRVIAQWENDTANFPKTDPEKYDVINSLDLGASVVAACLEYHRLHNVIPKAEIAADFVELKLRHGLKSSKYVKSQIEAAVKAATAAAAPPPKAAPSNGTSAHKHTGSSTLTDVASGTSASSGANTYPDDDDAKFRMVMDEMRSAGEI